MTGRNVKKQRDVAMKLLREGVRQKQFPSQYSADQEVRWIRDSISFLRRFEVEEQKKQAHTQRNGVKK